MKADSAAFDRAAKAYGLALKHGVYGELLTARSRFAWWFFHAGWRMRMVWDKNRRDAKMATALIGDPDCPTAVERDALADETKRIAGLLFIARSERDALRSRLAEAELARDSWKREAELNQQAADESANYAAQLAEAERSIDTLLGMIRHQRDVLRECLPYLNESMAGRRPGRSADDIRASVKALTADSASDDTALEPGEEWWMDIAGVPVKLDEWEPGAKKRKADQPEAVAGK